MTARPRKPWRVTLTGPDVHATSPFTSEAKAFAFVRTCLGQGSPADTARVEQWEDGRWRHFETMTADEIPDARPAAQRRGRPDAPRQALTRFNSAP